MALFLKKADAIFWRANIGVRKFRVGKICCVLFASNIRFEIRPFALLPTKSDLWIPKFLIPNSLSEI